MVHPTCAPARPPIFPPASETSPNPARVALAMQAAAELSALREAYRAATCIHDLLLQAQRSPDGGCDINRMEVRPLVALVNSEFERRMQTIKATIASMQAPPDN